MKYNTKVVIEQSEKLTALRGEVINSIPNEIKNINPILLRVISVVFMFFFRFI